VPSAAGTSSEIIGCGFIHETAVTVPFTITSFERLTGHE
jgi:hypothetical protein